MRRCPSCNSEFGDDVKFCMNCGTMLPDNAEAPQDNFTAHGAVTNRLSAADAPASGFAAQASPFSSSDADGGPNTVELKKRVASSMDSWEDSSSVYSEPSVRRAPALQEIDNEPQASSSGSGSSQNFDLFDETPAQKPSSSLSSGKKAVNSSSGSGSGSSDTAATILKIAGVSCIGCSVLIGVIFIILMIIGFAAGGGTAVN